MYMIDGFYGNFCDSYSSLYMEGGGIRAQINYIERNK